MKHSEQRQCKNDDDNQGNEADPNVHALAIQFDDIHAKDTRDEAQRNVNESQHSHLRRSPRDLRVLLRFPHRDGRNEELESLH